MNPRDIDSHNGKDKPMKDDAKDLAGDLARALLAFRQIPSYKANLCSTASDEDRKAFIADVTQGWNDRVARKLDYEQIKALAEKATAPNPTDAKGKTS